MGKGKGNRDDYRFLKLADALVAINQKVNLFGVIVEHDVPKRSKGTDWYCSLRIVDESHNSRGLLVNMFAETTENLPQVETAGDIILLSHVQMRIHNGEPYALFNKKFSSFALYEGKYGQGCNPYQASLKFRPRDQDMMFLDSLRKWEDGFQLDTVSQEIVLLRQLKVGEHVDLICKILHVSEVTKDQWMLFVWDGSDAPQLEIQSKLETEGESPLPLQLESQPLDRDTLCTFPTVGTILRALLDLQNVKLNRSSLSADRWVKFINLTVKVRDGLWLGAVMPSTKLRFVPSEDPLVVERQRDFERRLSTKWARMPYTSFPWPSRITVFLQTFQSEIDTELEKVPVLTLMDCITYSQVTAKFKCVVRVVATYPWKLEDLRSPSGIYRIQLTLEDPTARVYAYLYADDGEVFFDGYPPIDELRRKWNMLLGVAEVGSDELENVPRNPPWVQCCLKSYYLDKNDLWGSRKFRIFRTKLMC